MIRIAEYDDVDPLQVLHINLLCLDFALTPELVAVIRRMDPRPFPFFAVYAVAGRAVAGQVGVFRLPVVSAAGAEEVGGVWAIAIHPAWRKRGVAALLLDETHARMAAAGLRFSTLGANRYQVAHTLYKKQGYRDLATLTRYVLGPRTLLPAQPGLRAEAVGADRLALADRLFEQIARGRLGFARRHTPFFPFLHALSYLSAQDLWLLWQGEEAVGYAAAAHNGLLRVKNLLLADGVDALGAVSALAQATDARYIQARLDTPGYVAGFAQAGFQITGQRWGTLLVKPLAADATIEEFRRRYGLDDGRFLVSSLDVT